MTKVNFRHSAVLLLLSITVSSNIKAQSTSNKIVTGLFKAKQAYNTVRGANNTTADTKSTVTVVQVSCAFHLQKKVIYKQRKVNAVIMLYDGVTLATKELNPLSLISGVKS